MPTKENKDGSRLNTARSPRSSRNVDERNESEAQKRGFYGSASAPISRLGNHELSNTKRLQEDQGTERSIKRRRGQENQHDDKKDKDDEHVRVPDDHRPSKGHRCENYMCLENHSYQNCDKPKICWGCRSTGHHWSDCPMTCSRCLQEHHTANHCQDFELDQNGKSQPRACIPHPPTEPASYRARRELLERTHGKHPLPQKPVVSFPKRDRSEYREASHNFLDPSLGASHAARSPKSAPVEEGIPDVTIDQRLRHLRDTPILGSSPTGHTGQPNISSRDPRRGQSQALTPPSQPYNDLESSPTRNQEHLEAASYPNDHLVGHSLDIIVRLKEDARRKAFDESERPKQKQHEEGLAENERRQIQELDHELEEYFNQKTHDAEMARKAAVQKQEEAHKNRMAELRRRLKTS